MWKILTIGTCLSLFLSLSACIKVDSQKNKDDSDRSAEQTKADEKVENAKKDAAETIKKSNEIVMDTKSNGGQPGFISLSGGMVIDDKKVDSKIEVKLTTGKGWRGEKPEVSSDLLQMKGRLADFYIQELKEIKDNKTYVNIGCETSNRDEIKELEEKKFDLDNLDFAFIHAKVVLFCNGKKLKASQTYILAETVIFSALKYEMVGLLSDKTLSVTANILSLENQNQIFSKGQDSATTVINGPTISLAVNKVTGTGHLEIIAEGSSYLENPR